MSQNVQKYFPQTRLDELSKIAIAASRNIEAAKVSDPSPKVVELLNTWPESGNGEFKRDAAESFYVARMLEHIRAGVIEAEYPKLKFEELVPYDTTPDAGAENYTIQYQDQVGTVRVSKDMQGIIPRVDANLTEDSRPFFSLLTSYGYSLQDARAAIKAGRPLPQIRAMLAREHILRELNRIAALGRADVGLKGLLNLTGTATYTVPAGAGGSKGWALKTPREVLKDMFGAPSQVVVDTLEIEEPDTMIIPVSSMEDISQRPVGDGTVDTILTYHNRNARHIKKIETAYQLETNTGWTGKRMVCYEKNPNKVFMPVPVMFEQLPPDVTSRETVTICHARTAGVVTTRPKSIVYGDEI